MKSPIVAREREQAILARLLEEPTAQLLTVYGRRRIGKTFLIREYFDDSFAFKHTAISPLEFKDKEEKLLYRIQLDEFAHSLEKYGAKVESKLEDWFDAFHKLEDLLSRKKSKKKRDTGMELDFLVRLKGECVPLEVKAKSRILDWVCRFRS